MVELQATSVIFLPQSRVLPNVKDIYDGDLSPFGFNYLYPNPFGEGWKTTKEITRQDI